MRCEVRVVSLISINITHSPHLPSGYHNGAVALTNSTKPCDPAGKHCHRLGYLHLPLLQAVTFLLGMCTWHGAARRSVAGFAPTESTTPSGSSARSLLLPRPPFIPLRFASLPSVFPMHRSCLSAADSATAVRMCPGLRRPPSSPRSTGRLEQGQPSCNLHAAHFSRAISWDQG